MPIYEYECIKCGNVEEAFQKMSDAPLEICRQCGGSLSKIMSHSSFHLKGSGWYVTDYGGSSSSAKDNSSPQSKQVTTSKSDKSCSGPKCSSSCSNVNAKE